MHALYPRTKGFVATVQQLRTSHVRAVYDVTIAYADRRDFLSPPSMLQTLYQPALGKQYRMHAHVKRYELSSLPSDDADLAEWLEKRWMEKGVTLESLRKKLASGSPW